MTIRLLTHHVLIKLDDATEADETYKRAKALGIELALDKRESAAVEYGVIKQLGPTAFVDLGIDPSSVKVGDRVSLIKYAGKKVTDKCGTEYQIFNDEDILCVIE